MQEVTEIIIIQTTVEATYEDAQGTWTKFSCFSDYLCLGRLFHSGSAVQITIGPDKSRPAKPDQLESDQTPRAPDPT